jgi:Glycosyl transferases group 1
MPIVICSKSAWSPSIRREHAVAQSAAADGYRVTFVERALDARALFAAGSRGTWWRQLRSRPIEMEARIRVVGQSTVLPGHRSLLAQRMDAIRLAASLRRTPGIEASVVIATVPWQWPAIAATPAASRVFDCADDWRSLLAHRSGALDALYARIGREADAVVVASPDLVSAFPERRVAVVRNGASSVLIGAPLSPIPAERLMVYAGTLSERFDAPFLLAALEHLPDWSVELYGQCQYRGYGDGPSPELRSALLTGRVRWHGPVERSGLARVLDRARVLIAPHRGSLTRGQDSMKLYDYATRGRPIACTTGALGDRNHVAAAGVLQAATPAEFARIVRDHAEPEPSMVAAQRAWVSQNSWDARWPSWAQAVLGAAPPDRDGP